MLVFAFDIETIPNPNLPPECIPVFDPSTLKLGNVKDEIKIAAKIAEARAEFEAGLVKKMSVSQSLCTVCTFVGMMFDTAHDSPEETTSVQLGIDVDVDDEYVLVERAWQAIRGAAAGRIPIVTYNGISFDVPVLKTQAMRLDIPIVPSTIYKELTSKWGPTKLHYDLCKCLADFDMSKMEKLDFWLHYFGLGEKGDMDGSKVYEAWQAGEYEKIKKYCEKDVLNTCKLFARVAPWIRI